jgi:alkaline phosphatase D
MTWLRIVPCVALTVLMTVGCSSASREGLPPGSPFAEPSTTEDPLPQGTAVGDVTDRSAVLWLRTGGLQAVQVEWASVDAWEKMSGMATAAVKPSSSPIIHTGPQADFTLSLPLNDLSPATRYRYHIFVDGPERSGAFSRTLAATGEFTTLPERHRSVPVTFAWSGDLGGQGRCRRGEAGYHVFDVIRVQRPAFFLFLGDTIYADNPCPVPPNEAGAESIAQSLPDYRARHRYQRGALALRRFLEAIPVYVTWDDHEVKNNFSGPYESLMPAGRQALREYWPIQTAADDPHRLYRSIRYGTDLELFLLDTRQYRSRNADPDGPAKTMLGAAQLAWLLDGLRTSTATWKVVATTVPLSVAKGGNLLNPGFDGWAGGDDGTGFERERQVIVDAILSNRIKNVVFLAGDVHFVQANRYDPNGDGSPDFHEFVVGPLSAQPGRLQSPSPGLYPTNLITNGGYDNFGLVHVGPRTFEVTVIDDAGQTRFSHRLTSQE